MKPNICISCLIGLISIILTSCFGVESNPGHILAWLSYVKTDDTILIEFPVTVYNDDHHPIRSDKQVAFETQKFWCDTFIGGTNWVRTRRNADNIELHVSRITAHKDVEIFFIDDELRPLNLYTADLSYKYHVMDSLMDVYGVTMPVNKDLMTVPITTVPK